MSQPQDLNLAMAQLAMQQAQVAAAQKNPVAAVDLCTRAIGLAPHWQAPRHLLGLMHAEQGDFGQAAQVFADALIVERNQPMVWCALAEAQLKLAQPATAVASLQTAAALAPANAGVLNRLAMALRANGQEAEALAQFEAALLLEPRNTDVLCNHANALLRLNRVEAALGSYQAALDASVAQPRSRAVVLSNRAHALKQLGRLKEALADCDLAISLAPEHATAHLRRAEVLAEAGQLDTAVEACEHALELAPGSGDTQAVRASLLLRDDARAADAVQACAESAAVHMASLYGQKSDGIGINRLRGQGLAAFRLKHDLEQARHLQECGVDLPGLQAFLDTGGALQASAHGNNTIRVTEAQIQAMLPYLRAPWQHPHDAFEGPCLNPDTDWRGVEDAYLQRTPELVWIDDFLSPVALAWFRTFCLRSRVWQAEYQGKYLGAFAVKGFVSPVHLQLARELKLAMPKIFAPHELTHLWAFKYDATLGTGINMHADFARVNLNFWITPDEFNLDADSGGMVVYDAPAPADWSFHQYNSGGEVITRFLQDRGAQAVKVPYRCNRAVLFNSALFHETDRIAFADTYEGRRINMTYLFGRQLL
ncbi:MAG: hypothetical protein RLZZ126_243 [Pseudomonadota bacterium]|jgi:tetratricopeptide (TPR) repeat protein